MLQQSLLLKYLFPCPSTTSQSKTTSCTKEVARQSIALVQNCAYFPVTFHFFQQFSEGSLRSLNPAFSAVRQGQKAKTEKRNKEKMNANNVYSNKGKLHTKGSD